MSIKIEAEDNFEECWADSGDDMKEALSDDGEDGKPPYSYIALITMAINSR